MTSQTPPGRERTRPDGGASGARSRAVWIGIAIVAVVIAAVIVWRVGGPRRAPAPADLDAAPVATGPAATAPAHGGPPVAAPGQTAPAPDAQKVVGRWVRLDAPYVIDIASATEDGILEAAYYNPRPINVSRAEAREVDGELEVFVELRDAGYPGSTYTLRFDPTGDRLSGVYYQAALRESYDIEFMRVVARQ